jgi:hypothetical protein
MMRCVSVETLKHELAALPPGERREIVGFLVGLDRRERRAAYERDMAARLDDQSPGAWLTIEDADGRLDWRSDAP